MAAARNGKNGILEKVSLKTRQSLMISDRMLRKCSPGRQTIGAGVFVSGPDLSSASVLPLSSGANASRLS